METSPLVCRANEWTGFYMILTSIMKELKVHSCIFENLLIRFCSYKNITLNSLFNYLNYHYSITWILRILVLFTVNFVFSWKSRILLNVLNSLRIFINRYFVYLNWAYLKKWKVLSIVYCLYTVCVSKSQRYWFAMQIIRLVAIWKGPMPWSSY